MSKLFYSRLAFTNIKKNKSIYLPYLMASTLIVGLCYILRSVTIMVEQSGAKGADYMSFILGFSFWIFATIAILILLYINSFVMKRRKKEFGLYSILGMEKRHISIVIFFEVLFTGLLSLVVGILGGALLSQLMFLLLLYIVGIPSPLTFSIPLDAVSMTIVLFLYIFAFILLYDIVSICRTNPIDLLHSSKEGEREPKARWLLALGGVLTLGGGYVLACIVGNPADALLMFFPCVMLVIIGTYLLFIAGSIAVLKLMRKNRKFYYKPQNFISVSGMIYRMKQNAAGLATICILSTCVLTTLSFTVSLFIGEEDTLRSQFPRQIHVTCTDADKASGALMNQAAQDYAKFYGFTVENPFGYAALEFTTVKDGNHFQSSADDFSGQYYSISCIPLSDYNQASGSNESLAPDEVLYYDSDLTEEMDSIQIGNLTYRVKKAIPSPDLFNNTIGMSRATVIMPSLDEVNRLLADINGSSASYQRITRYHYYFDVQGDQNQLPAFYENLRDGFNKTVPHLSFIKNIDDTRDDFYQLYGSFLFVGVFFVVLFLIATVLIIYYKQITEGFDDHDRFQIMQKVGMSDKEVRRTIQKQVLMVFFLPLGMAVLHMIVAYPVLCKIMTAFSMTDTTPFFICTIVTILLFAILYFIVYQRTARTYYRIVQNMN
ncbi:ABC transporter permease [Clostridium sp. D33t1_170424_F3]|uniref:FtsX-like permease family protein n=1 Tax=Clostridium sp. D33t1_170424_F3 TaxID=2787099 RepID=UPI0018A98AA1|nr:ABC transporter permease [Clostridium sp. D33t1_170424_F3]